jgi:phosphoserine phosphatase
MSRQECIDELADSAGLKDRVATITERVWRDRLRAGTTQARRAQICASTPVVFPRSLIVGVVA